METYIKKLDKFVKLNWWEPYPGDYDKIDAKEVNKILNKGKKEVFREVIHRMNDQGFDINTIANIINQSPEYVQKILS